MKTKRHLLVSLALVLSPLLLHVVQAQVSSIPANLADVESIDAIISASYDVISGSKDMSRDWDRERSLFYPGSRHMPTRRDSTGKFVADIMGVDGFIDRAQPYFEMKDFYEYEIARKVDRFGNIAHVFSTYEWKNELHGPVGGRGINSFQLFFDGERWWILSVFWQQESEGFPIPKEYLPGTN